MGARWVCQAASGFAHGIAVSFHLPYDQHIVFGVDRLAPLPKSGPELTVLVAYTHLFATFVQTAAQSVFGMPRRCSAKPIATVHLSRREHECLQWAAEGKTAWETGMILSIAEGTVVKILASAIRKLDCANKPQAVVKALRLRLIH
jgi:DNA-binding CsgD family transcriptional regulator